LLVGAVEAPVRLTPFRHQARLTQNRDVLRDRWPAHIELLGDVPGREFALPDEPKDLTPPSA